MFDHTEGGGKSRDRARRRSPAMSGEGGGGEMWTNANKGKEFARGLKPKKKSVSASEREK